MSALWTQAPEPGFEIAQPPPDPGPGTSSKGHDHLVRGKRASRMEPPVQLRCQSLSVSGWPPGPTLSDPLLPLWFAPRSSGGLCGRELHVSTLFQLRQEAFPGPAPPVELEACLARSLFKVGLRGHSRSWPEGSSPWPSPS